MVDPPKARNPTLKWSGECNFPSSMPETSIRGPRVMAREDTISFGAGSRASSVVINMTPAAALGVYPATVAAANRPIQIDVCLWICMVVTHPLPSDFRSPARHSQYSTAERAPARTRCVSRDNASTPPNGIVDLGTVDTLEN